MEIKNRKKRAEELLGIIGRLGPAIIKAGQALSSRPDLLPKEYLDELQKLQVTLTSLNHGHDHDIIMFSQSMAHFPEVLPEVTKFKMQR